MTSDDCDLWGRKKPCPCSVARASGLRCFSVVVLLYLSRILFFRVTASSLLATVVYIHVYRFLPFYDSIPCFLLFLSVVYSFLSTSVLAIVSVSFFSAGIPESFWSLFRGFPSPLLPQARLVSAVSSLFSHSVSGWWWRFFSRFSSRW